MLHHVVIEVDAAQLIASEEHQADLIREFQLISFGPESPALPGRLAELIVETLRDYQGTQEGNLAAAHAALARGDQMVRLEMDLPVEVCGAVQSILGALEEADAYCQRGDGLLTLATPPDIAALRRWFVDELIRQVEASAGIRAPAAGG
jgi:hypothetical protein